MCAKQHPAFHTLLASTGDRWRPSPGPENHLASHQRAPRAGSRTGSAASTAPDSALGGASRSRRDRARSCALRDRDHLRRSRPRDDRPVDHRRCAATSRTAHRHRRAWSLRASTHRIAADAQRRHGPLVPARRGRCRGLSGRPPATPRASGRGSDGTRSRPALAGQRHSRPLTLAEHSRIAPRAPDPNRPLHRPERSTRVAHNIAPTAAGVIHPSTPPGRARARVRPEQHHGPSAGRGNGP